jgi:hypothetical protein
MEGISYRNLIILGNLKWPNWGKVVKGGFGDEDGG